MLAKVRSWGPSWGKKEFVYDRFFFAAIFSILLISSVFYSVANEHVSLQIIPSNEPTTSNKFQHSLTNDEFVKMAIQSTLGAYNSSGVHNHCAKGTWNPKEVMNCDRIFGGVGNTRQRILTCLHEAMKTGRGFIIPTISLRDSDDLSSLEASGEAPFSYSFNEDLFITRLTAACPNMPIYRDLASAEDPNIKVHHFPSLLCQMNICEDHPDFAANFGSLLTFPTQIYRLAFSALHTLSTVHHLSIDPTALSASSNYLGVHLRTAKDAVQAGWASASYDTQTSNYLLLANLLQYPIIYVASGDASSVAQFTKEAKTLSPPVTVITKEQLLFGNDLLELKSMTWDQMALIDSIILESAGFFSGIQESSYSWNVAMRRAMLRGGEAGICGERNETLKNGWWKDNWSQVIGNRPEGFKGRLWP